MSRNESPLASNSTARSSNCCVWPLRCSPIYELKGSARPATCGNAYSTRPSAVVSRIFAIAVAMALARPRAVLIMTPAKRIPALGLQCLLDNQLRSQPGQFRARLGMP